MVQTIESLRQIKGTLYINRSEVRFTVFVRLKNSTGVQTE